MSMGSHSSPRLAALMFLPSRCHPGSDGWSTMKFGEVRRRLQSEGFEIISQNGSHEQWKKPGSPDALQLPEKTVTLSVIKQ